MGDRGMAHQELLLPDVQGVPPGYGRFEVRYHVHSCEKRKRGLPGVNLFGDLESATLTCEHHPCGEVPDCVLEQLRVLKDVRIGYKSDQAVDTVAVWMKPARAQDVQSLPGVVGIRPAPQMYLGELD